MVGRFRGEFRATLTTISAEFRGGFLRNYMPLETRYVCGEIDGETFRRSVALMQDDIRAVASAEKGVVG